MNDKLDIMILGKPLRVTATSNEELNDLHKAARALDQKMHIIQAQNPNAPIEKIAILVALNATHELMSLQNDLDAHLVKIEQLVIG
jgi:cell division protein ZapA (FtsZ GTPase activity inhibitor)